eukprot:1293206-Pleurochrysis_carterae.AAC.1
MLCGVCAGRRARTGVGFPLATTVQSSVHPRRSTPVHASPRQSTPVHAGSRRGPRSSALSASACSVGRSVTRLARWCAGRRARAG